MEQHNPHVHYAPTANHALHLLLEQRKSSANATEVHHPVACDVSMLCFVSVVKDSHHMKAGVTHSA